MNEVFLFLTCIVAGAVLRVIYVLQRTLAKKTDLIAVTVILDFIFAAATVLLLWTIIYFLGRGLFRTYLPIGMLAGFLLLTIFIKSPKVELKRRKKESKPKTKTKTAIKTESKEKKKISTTQIKLRKQKKTP